MSQSDELEVAAHMTEEEAVRRVFDAQNVRWTAVGALIFMFADVIVFGFCVTSKRSPPFGWAVAVIAFLASATAARIAYQLANARRGREFPPVATFVSRNTSDWVVGYFLLELSALAYAGGSRSAIFFGAVFPWITLGLRFSFPRRLLFQLCIVAITAVGLFVGSGEGPRAIGSSLVSNALSLPVGVLTSRRLRRRSIEEWAERRDSAREQLRMRGELLYARELQLSMLPDEPPALEWADLAGVSIPATEVGGDYFDYLEVDGSLVVLSGDVAGHGLASGITLSALRGGITLLKHSFENPAEVLERLHEVVAESSRRRTLVTFAAARFDPVARRVRVANAGHPPLLVRHAGGVVDAIELFGSPLGVRRNEPIPQRELAFDRGDVFLFHTDGIYETTNDDGEQFGLERLARVLAAATGRASEIRDSILRDVDSFRGVAAQEDDVTMVVVKII